MLTEVMTNIRNFFVIQGIEIDTSLINSVIELETVNLPKQNQYIYIKGTLFQGVCKVTVINGNQVTVESDVPLVDSELEYMALLAIPNIFIKLVEEIKEWQLKNGDATYQSESFGGWSGTRAQGTSGPLTWQEKFNDRLKVYRRFITDLRR